MAPGRFMFFRSPIVALFITSAVAAPRHGLSIDVPQRLLNSTC
jgi:hypothetical protein